MRSMLEEFPGIFTSKKIYRPEEIDEVLKVVRPHFRFSWSNKKLKYFNVPAAFDIETSSFYTGSEKTACMYEWTLGIYGAVIIGRTWGEFVTCINRLADALELNEQKRLIVYVHNLAFEFQWFRKYFKWSKIFAIDSRKPLYAVTENNIEFRCSLLLSGYSLANLGGKLTKYRVEKAVGDLDYSKIRHSATPLTQKEIGYCVNDVKVVMGYVAELIDRENGISRLPLTKTGFVRRYCRNACFYGDGSDEYQRFKYRALMVAMNLDPEEYVQLKRGFQGGFTHANPFYSARVMEDVTSFDFTSSYPAVMVAEKYPISTSEKITIESREQLEENLNIYCCLFDVEFVGLESVVLYESYISQSRCFALENPTINNGRVVRADLLRTTLTEQDFMIINKMYDWESMRVSNFRRYRKGYLPTEFIKAILHLYRDKTTLKGVEGKEVDYQIAKENLNSCYGMAVTDIVRPAYGYGDEWEDPEAPDIESSIHKYNKSAGRFLFFPWGCWVTAYARRNLYTGIFEFENDYIYSDTDSIKCLNAEKHRTYIERYNKAITEQLEKAMEYHGLSLDMVKPKNSKGVEKPLGVWDFDGHYKRFKTLGAKRYMVEYSNDARNGSDSGKVSITVAGLAKRAAVPYIKSKGVDPFKVFNNQMHIPAEHTGKLTHTYIDEPQSGTVTDYTGSAGRFSELTAVHLEPADYSLSMAREYVDYIMKRQTEVL